MPGNWVKDWPTYEALRKKGRSKGSAARIANAQAARKKSKKKLRFKGKGKGRGKMQFRREPPIDETMNGTSPLTA